MPLRSTPAGSNESNESPAAAAVRRRAERASAETVRALQEDAGVEVNVRSVPESRLLAAAGVDRPELLAWKAAAAEEAQASVRYYHNGIYAAVGMDVPLSPDSTPAADEVLAQLDRPNPLASTHQVPLPGFDARERLAA